MRFPMTEDRLQRIASALDDDTLVASYARLLSADDLLSAVRLALPVLLALSANGSGDYAVTMANEALAEIGYIPPSHAGGE